MRATAGLLPLRGRLLDLVQLQLSQLPHLLHPRPVSRAGLCQRLYMYDTRISEGIVGLGSDTKFLSSDLSSSRAFRNKDRAVALSKNHRNTYCAVASASKTGVLTLQTSQSAQMTYHQLLSVGTAVLARRSAGKHCCGLARHGIAHPWTRMIASRRRNAASVGHSGARKAQVLLSGI